MIGKHQLELAETAPVLVREATRGFSRTVEMPNRPRQALAPNRVVFAGEPVATIDEFVELRLASEHVTFLAVLERRGITPAQYAALRARFDLARQNDPSLDAAYVARLALRRQKLSAL